MDVEVNYLAVLLAGVASMVVGMVWYAKRTFGNTWIKLANLDEKTLTESSPKALSLTFVASLVTAYVLAHVTYLSNNFFGNSFLQDALTTAIWMWLGFTAARILTHDLFEKRPTKLTAITVGFELVTLLAMGLVIGLMSV